MEEDEFSPAELYIIASHHPADEVRLRAIEQLVRIEDPDADVISFGFRALAKYTTDGCDDGFAKEVNDIFQKQVAKFEEKLENMARSGMYRQIIELSRSRDLPLSLVEKARRFKPISAECANRGAEYFSHNRSVQEELIAVESDKTLPVKTRMKAREFLQLIARMAFEIPHPDTIDLVEDAANEGRDASGRDSKKKGGPKPTERLALLDNHMLFILALYHPDGNMRKASAAIFCLKKEFTLDTISHGTRIITRELNAHGETRKADPWYKNLKKVIGDMALPVIRRHIKELEGASLSGSFQELDTISRDKRMPKTIREKAAELKPIAARSVILKLVSDPVSRKIHNELALVSMDPSMPLEIRAEVNSVLQGLARNLERTSQPAPSRAELERKTKTNELATLLRTMRPPPPSKPPDVVPGIKSLAKLLSN